MTAGLPQVSSDLADRAIQRRRTSYALPNRGVVPTLSPPIGHRLHGLTGADLGFDEQVSVGLTFLADNIDNAAAAPCTNEAVRAVSAGLRVTREAILNAELFHAGSFDRIPHKSSHLGIVDPGVGRTFIDAIFPPVKVAAVGSSNPYIVHLRAKWMAG